MAEKKNTQFDRPGGYATPRGATHVQSRAAIELKAATDAAFAAHHAGEKTSGGGIHLDGDAAPRHEPKVNLNVKPAFSASDPDTRLYVGDCRDLLYSIPECANGEIDLIFADPPFNWDVPYDSWKDGMPRREYTVSCPQLRPRGPLVRIDE